MRYEYTLIRSPRRRTVGITVNPDSSITVRAPERVPESAIQHILEQKAEWIRGKVELSLNNHRRRAPKRYEDDEEFLFLGKTIRLKKVPGGKGVSLRDDRLTVGVTEGGNGNERSRMIALLGDWYRDQAAHILADRILFWRERVNAYPKTMRVKRLKSRWGSCSNRGNVNFNWLLILAPPQIVDYVVVHELCHFHHPNHSRAFWDAVRSVLPDYQERRKWLKANTEFLTLD